MYSEEYSTIEPSQSEQLYPKSSSGKTQSCRKTLQIAGEVVIEPSCVTGKVAYYALSSILAIGILMLVLIPIGSTFLYIDYKQQLAQRKSNKNDLCKSKCSFGADCIIDDYTNQPFCRCPLSCTDDYEPVCGSDGITHLNLCHLRFDSCNKQQPISVLTNGACEPTNQCDNVTCHRYQKCQVNEHGKAQCVCAINTNCNGNDWKHQQQQPVCGSNHKLYGSLCELQKHSCQNNLDVMPTTNLDSCLAHADNNRQRVGNKCDHMTCVRYAQCKIQSNSNQSCSCPSECGPQGNETYCGVNDEGYNRNFANICELECLQENFKVLHRGQCGQCTEQCQHHSECKLNEFGVPTCMCQSVCESLNQPVCGDNGVTYMNICELRVDSCRLQKHITVRWNGSCDRCDDVQCPHGATCIDGDCVCDNNCENEAPEPLCANDGTTYIHECDMNRKACTTKKELIALFYGECEESMSNSEKYVEDSAYMLPSKEFDPSLHLTPSECHHLFQTCRQARLEADDVYVCEDRLFGTKCDMVEFECRNTNNGHKCGQYCHCNRYGLKRDTIPGCNPSTGQCACKTGVTGTKCDKCDKNYWNFRYLIDDPRAVGCKPCSCNRFGSLSEDCDKLTGKCRCRAGVTGLKCDQCHNTEWQLTNRGCVPIKTEQFNGNPCQHHQCHYGAICLHNGINAHCTCQLDCPKTNQSSNRICASDGSIHSSMCHFREHTCHLRKRLHVVKHCVN